MTTERSPCKPEQVCPVTTQMKQRGIKSSDGDTETASQLPTDLIDCDSGTATCVCQRGYVLVDGNCVGKFVAASHMHAPACLPACMVCMYLTVDIVPSVILPICVDYLLRFMLLFSQE